MRQKNLISNEEYLSRVSKVQSAMKQEGLDVLLCYADAWRISNVAYFVDYRSFDGILPISYAIIAIESTGLPKLYLFSTCLPLAEFTWLKTARALDYLIPDLQETAKKGKLGSLGIAGYGLMPAELFNSIKDSLPGVTVLATQLLNKIKSKKSSADIEMMKKAAQITDLAMDAIHEALSSGSYTEFELAAIANYEMMKAGAEGPAFDTMIQSGSNSWRNLRRPTDRVVERGDVILIDVGARYQGYSCDIARGVCYGNVDSRAKTMLLTAIKAYEAGLAAVKPGVRALEVDNAVRNVFREYGCEEYFTEASGHGVGHDPEEEIPFIVPGTDCIIEQDMTLVVKSALMIPGLGGVRIEDEVFVCSDGPQLITNYPRNLLWD